MLNLLEEFMASFTSWSYKKTNHCLKPCQTLVEVAVFTISHMAVII